MLDELARIFTQSLQEADAINLLRNIRCSGFHNIGTTIGKFLEKQFPHSVDIKDEYALNMYFTGDLEKSYNIYNKLLKFKCIPEHVAKYAVIDSLISSQDIDLHCCDGKAGPPIAAETARR